MVNCFLFHLALVLRIPLNMIRCRLVAYVFLLALGFVLAGCLSPTLPLPPPDSVVVSPPDMNGLVAVEGQVRDEAYVNCLNERTEKGVIVKSSEFGFFRLEIEAQIHDDLTLWQTLGSKTGTFISATVPSADEPTDQDALRGL